MEHSFSGFVKAVDNPTTANDNLKPVNPEFIAFPKIGRLSREVVITEKIDGTNAVIMINDDGDFFVGSRSRWITPGDDNFGFAGWAHKNRGELMKLGPGRHYGEWWGPGIQRGYGQKEKRFSLFNTHRWSDDAVRPACCHVVPVLAKLAYFDTIEIDDVMWTLQQKGSAASPGFMRPEGIVIYHPQTGSIFKKTFEGDEAGKGKEPMREIAA